MVKSYLRYVPSRVAGVIATPAAHVAVDAAGRFAFAPALEDVGVWDLKRGVQVHTISYSVADYSARAEVTCLSVCPRGRHLAIGYADGDVRVCDTSSWRVAVVLHGHRKAVTSLAFSMDGLYLSSGSRDTTAIVWDVVSESGLAQLRAHRDEVTDVAFLDTAAWSSSSHRAPASDAPDAVREVGVTARYLVTVCKDTITRVWALTSYACIASIVGARCELWSLCILPGADRVLVGGSTNVVQVWAVGDRPVSTGGDAARAGAEAEGEAALPDDSSLLQSMGTIVRQTHDRTSRLRCSADGRLIAVQAAGRLIEVLRRRDESEVRKRVLRRLRRHREKLSRRGRVEAGDDADAAAADADENDEDGLRLGTSLADVEALLARLERDDAAHKKSKSSDGTAPVSHSELVIASDEFELVAVVQCSVKIASCSFLPYDTGSSASKGSIGLLVTTQANEIEVYRIPLDASAAKQLEAGSIITSAGTRVTQAVLSRSIAFAGHRTDVRSVSISSDSTMVMSTSTGSVKVWNAKTGAAVRTLELGEADVGLACAFCPGDRHGLVALKDGHLRLYDLSSGDLLEDVAAHAGSIWSIAMRPDGKTFMTGSADKELKFWDFDVATKGAKSASEAAQQQVLTIAHTRTLKLTDEVLCARYSNHTDPAKLLVAVALLDSTVKVFFDDTLRFSLSLYGHKLPVMSLDISADSTLLVTASADKNVKLWGLDFGDCHRSFLAHDDVVTGVCFLAKTHYFFSCSKDRRIKYWDGDRFEHIITLEGHKSEVWCVAAAKDGTFLVSGSHDRSLRFWQRSEQQVFLEEEREREMDARMDAFTRDDDAAALLGSTGDAVGPLGADGFAAPIDEDKAVAAAPLSGATAPEVSLVVARAHKDTMKGTDRLLEALALAAAESDKWLEYQQDLTAARAAGDPDSVVAAPPENPELLGLTPAHYVARTLAALRPGDVEQVVLVLPFADALALLKYMVVLLQQRRSVELCARVALLVVRVHQRQLIANGTPAHTALLVALHAAVHSSLSSLHDVCGYNAAGLRFLDKLLASSAGTRAAAAAPLPPTADRALAAKKAEDRKAKRRAEEEERAGEFRLGKRAHARIF